MQTAFEIKECVENERSPFGDWRACLDPVTRARIEKYIRRLEFGNFGSVKALQEGVFELKMDFGPGYRAYFGRDGNTIIILLGGGSKRRQYADIAAAIGRWTRYKQLRN